METNLKIIDIKDTISFYNSIIFWIITLIFGSSYPLFKDIDNQFVCIMLPVLILFSGLCILFLALKIRLYIKRNNDFNNFKKFIDAAINNQYINTDDYIKLMDECNIQYKIKNNIIESKESLLEKLFNIFYNSLYIISIIIYVILYGIMIFI